MVGVGAIATSEVLRLVEDAQQAGADALLLPMMSDLLRKQRLIGHHRQEQCIRPGLLGIFHQPQHLAGLTDAGVDSLGILGSTGSYAYLSREQRKRVVQVAKA
jgi:dihydrodipicolinate synthase/N-acetylneuraminate lyase